MENPVKEYKKVPLTEVLDRVLIKAAGKPLRIEDILGVLSGKGYPFIIAFLTLPFCLPIQIPGLSTPFGIVICFLALRMVFSHHRWWPKLLLRKEVSYKSLETIVTKAKSMAQKAQKLVHPRFVFLVENFWLYKLHGIVITLLGLVLALPLPIPLSNLTAGYPIVFICLGLLEDDGLAVMIGYLLTIICVIYLFVVIPYGLESLYHYDLTGKS